MSMRMTIVGCGDAFGSAGRLNACFKVDAGDRTVLLDCGASSLVGLKILGIDPNAIDAIILSHLHGDHFGGLPFMLLDAQFASRRAKPLTVAGPPGTRARLDTLLNTMFAGSTGIAWQFPWNVAEIVPEQPIEIAGFSVLTTEVDHPSGAPSTGIRLSHGGRVLAYSGDTQWTDALIGIAREADLFLVECCSYADPIPYHLNWKVLEAKLPALGARRVMITHMNPSMLERIDEARAAGVLIAVEGQVVDI